MSRWFTYQDGETTVRVRADLFVQRAIQEYREFGDKTKLVMAVELNMPELWDSAEARALLLEQVKNDGIGKRGHKPEKAKRDHFRDRKIWLRVWYWHGYGNPIWDSVTPAATASAKAAEGLGVTPERAYKIFRKMQNDRLIDPNLMWMTDVYFHKGQSDAGLEYNSKPVSDFAIDYMKDRK